MPKATKKRIHLQVSPELYELIKSESEIRGKGMEEYIVYALTGWIGKVKADRKWNYAGAWQRVHIKFTKFVEEDRT